MKIATLILHIVCAVLFGVCAVTDTSMISSILYMIASIIWSVNIGIDIAHFTFDD